jgi:hypothetical protein
MKLLKIDMNKCSALISEMRDGETEKEPGEDEMGKRTNCAFVISIFH